jgi:arabinofuranan 3-O-arabinosyltransferase
MIASRFRRFNPSLLVLAAIAYIPALASSPGRMPADTKLFLYLDPGRLIADAPSTWDVRQFGGWVPHQMISYLWPSGPWFWLFNRIGVPVWVAHRLWIATVMVVAGWGVLRLARTLGLAPVGAFCAAAVYQLSPYTIPYVSRTSLMLLPWAAVGWLTLLTIRSYRHGGWRGPALFALVIFTVAGVNATAFLMIVPGPVLWVLIEWGAKRLSSRQVLTTTARLGALSVAVSLWWVVMLSIQGKYGADLLSYSETLQAVSLTSTSTEVLRGLGYWLFYIRDPYAAATTAALPYQTSGRLIAAGFALLIVCCLGFILTRWRHRAYAVALVVVGVVLSVGVHPYSDPAPAMRVLRSSGLGLALRSSTRALPLFALGLGLSAGALAVAVAGRWSRLRLAAPVLVCGLAALNVPSLWAAHLVDPALRRDEHPPAAWTQAAAALDAGNTQARVLQLPGSEFGAFRWGYTVDPPLPGLTAKPLITRDLLPLGSPGVMDLLYALDNRIQAGALDTNSVAPVARFLGADTVWVTNDLAFDRFRTPRPEPFSRLIGGDVSGLGATRQFGPPQVNTPDIPMVDEQSIANPSIGTPLPDVTLRSVSDPVDPVRVATRVVVLDGSGDGIVDAASAGLLHGDEAVLYANDLTPAQLAALTSPPAGSPQNLQIVTDSNRDRDYQWRGSQDGVGMTESGGPASDGGHTDAAKQRLGVFATTSAAGQTIATLDNGLVVQATSYGEPFAFLPEARAAMAVDGDVSTSWRVGERADPRGESISVSTVADGQLRLVQPQDRSLRLMITSVDVSSGGTRQHIVLTNDSLLPAGQIVPVPSAAPVTITISSVAERPGAPPTGEAWVGFAEIGPVVGEFVRPPVTLTSGLAPASPFAIVFNRDRVKGTDRWRADPEPFLARSLDLPASLSGTMRVTLRLNSRAGDAAIDQLAGWSQAPVSNDRLAGVPGARADAAFDGDPATRWISPFYSAVGSSISTAIRPDVDISTLDITQPPSADLSTITAVAVTIGPTTRQLEVPPPDANGVSHLTFPADRGDRLTIEVIAIAARTTIDRRYGEPAQLPVAISEISGVPVERVATVPSTCRHDLLRIDGQPIGVTVDPALLLAGGAEAATLCDTGQLTLTAGAHRFASAPGRVTGIDIDLMSFSNVDAAATRPAVGPGPSATLVGKPTATHTTAQVTACPSGCWFIFGQGRNAGWSATAGGTSLGPSTQISGGFNGWWLTPSDQPRTIQINFRPQRTLDIALSISAPAVLLCLVLSLRRRTGWTAPPAATISIVDPRQTVSRRRAIIAGAVCTVSAAAFVSPAWGAAGLAVGAVIVLVRRPAVAAVAGLGAIGLAGALVVRREMVYRYGPNGGWPGSFRDLHRPVLFAVVVLAMAAFVDDDFGPRPATEHQTAQRGTGDRDGTD